MAKHASSNLTDYDGASDIYLGVAKQVNFARGSTAAAVGVIQSDQNSPDSPQ